MNFSIADLVLLGVVSVVLAGLFFYVLYGVLSGWRRVPIWREGTEEDPAFFGPPDELIKKNDDIHGWATREKSPIFFYMSGLFYLLLSGIVFAGTLQCFIAEIRRH